jgi:hypothetical protein
MMPPGSRRGPLLSIRARRPPPIRPSLQVPPFAAHRRGSQPWRAPCQPEEAVGFLRDRQQVEGVQLGKEARPGCPKKGTDRLRALPGPASQEAATIRGAQVPGQGQGLGIIWWFTARRSTHGGCLDVGIRLKEMDLDRKRIAAAKGCCIYFCSRPGRAVCHISSTG